MVFWCPWLKQLDYPFGDDFFLAHNIVSNFCVPYLIQNDIFMLFPVYVFE